MNTIKKTLLYCGLTREEYEAISPLINERNHSSISIISIAMAIFGSVFMVSWVFGAASVLYPYLFLIFCGLFALLTVKTVMKRIWIFFWQPGTEACRAGPEDPAARRFSVRKRGASWGTPGTHSILSKG